LTVGFGILLIIIGLAGYLATGHEHPTALIPAGLGIPMLILGVVAANEARRKHAMHGALTLALLGFFGCLKGLLKLPLLLSGGHVERPVAVADQALTALLCLAFIALGVRSFVAARRNSPNRTDL